MTLACVSSVPLGVFAEVEGGVDDDTVSEVIAVVIGCVVVGGCGVLSLVITLNKSFFVVWGAALVVFSATCSDAEEVVVPAKDKQHKNSVNMHSICT